MEKNTGRDVKYDKMAFLLFTANVETNYGKMECTVMSTPISLSKCF